MSGFPFGGKKFTPKKFFPGPSGIAEKLPQSPKAQQLLRRLDDVAARVPEISGPVLDFLKEHLALDPEGPFERLRADLKAQLKNNPMLAFGGDIVNRLRSGGRARRFATEILGPAYQRKLSASAVWQRTNLLLTESPGATTRSTTRSKPASDEPKSFFPIYDLMRSMAQKFPNWTIGIGVVPEAGMFVGYERTFGFAGMHHRETVFYDSHTAGIGAYAELGFAIEAIFAPCVPAAIEGVSFGLDIGGAYGLGLTVGCGIKPKDLRRALFPMPGEPKHLRLDELDCLTVGVPIGAGGEVSLCVDYTKVLVRLWGTTESPPAQDAPDVHDPDRTPQNPPLPQKPHPNAPSDLQVTLQRDKPEEGKEVEPHGIAKLSWIAYEHTHNEPTGRARAREKQGFFVERAAHQSMHFKRIATLHSDVTTYEEPVANRYDYRVQAHCGDAVSGYSNTATWQKKGGGHSPK